MLDRIYRSMFLHLLHRCRLQLQAPCRQMKKCEQHIVVYGGKTVETNLPQVFPIHSTIDLPGMGTIAKATLIPVTFLIVTLFSPVTFTSVRQFVNASSLFGGSSDTASCLRFLLWTIETKTTPL
mmetsp:Transcript_57761/g.141081  ORF Transcript_57761/g.141081 Transcript_57761/m.141081 type:complete len:124 (-) Transcript_57761:86-457(-)